jgi:hypothetical protein
MDALFSLGRDPRARQAAVGEAGAPFELARILDFGARLCITEPCYLLEAARSLLPCVAP